MKIDAGTHRLCQHIAVAMCDLWPWRDDGDVLLAVLSEARAFEADAAAMLLARCPDVTIDQLRSAIDNAPELARVFGRWIERRWSEE